MRTCGGPAAWRIRGCEPMRQAMEDYLNQGRAEGWSEKTLEAYRARLDHLGRSLGWPRPAEVKPGDLDRYFAALKRADWKRESRRSLASTARHFFGWLAERGKVLSSPARHLRIEREDEEALPPPPLSVEEVGALLDGLPRRNVVDLRHRALLELLYGCGLRLAEALALDLPDMDAAGRILHVRKGKGSKARDLPLGRGALHALRDYLALRRSLVRGPDMGALFLDRLGRRVTEASVRGWFDKLNAARDPGAQRLHPHLFRHSIAVHLLQNGADIRYVQQFLGHANLNTTKIYLRLVPGRLKEDYEKAFPDIAVQP